MAVNVEEDFENYKLITENANDLISVLNDKLEIKYINETAHFHILGYNKEDLIGKSGIDISHPDEYNKLRQFFLKIFKEEQETQISRFLHKNGTWIWVDIKGKRFEDNLGKQNILLIGRNITERIKSERKLKNERNKAKMYLNLAGVILVALNKEGVITLMNKKGYEVLDYEEGELIGKNWFETCLPLHRKEQVFEVFNKLIAGELEPVEYFENPIITKNGQEKIIAWHNALLYDEKKKIIGTISSGEDITERKKVKQSLEDSEENYRLITENSNDLIRVLNEKLEIEYINEKTHQKILGYTEEDLIGKISTKINHPEDFRQIRQFMIKLFETGEAIHETRIKHKNGDWFWFEVKAKSFKDNNGNQKYLLISRDITDRKKVIIDLRDYNRRLEILNRIIISANRTESLSSLLEEVLNLILELLDFEGGGIYLVDKKKRKAEVVLYKGLPIDFVESVKTVNIDEGNYKSIFIEQRPIITNNYAQINPERSKKWEIVSIASIPLVFKNRVIGAINVASKTRHSFLIEEIEILQSIGREIGTVIARMKAEHDLKESEEKYRHLFEKSPNKIMLLDSSGIITGVNTPFLTYFGYNMNELIGNDFRTIEKFSPEKRSFYQKIYNEVLSKGVFEPIQFQVGDKDDIKKWMELRASLIEIENKGIIQVIIQDIDERKKAEESLKAERDKLKAIIDGLTTAGLGIDIIGDNYIVQYMNELMKERFGDFTSKLCYETYMNLKEPCEDCPAMKSMKNNTVEHVEQSAVDNRNYELFSAPIHNPDGTIDKAIELVIDITERKKAEKNLKESEEKYRKLFETMTEGVVLINKDGIIDEANPAAENILGLTRSEIEGDYYLDPVRNFLRPNGTQIHTGEGAITRAIKEKIIVENVIEGMERPGKPIAWLDFSAAPLMEATGEFYGVVCTFSDITERKEAQEKLIESEEKFRTIAEQSLIGIAIIQDNIIKYLNEKFADILGYTTREIMNRSPKEFLKTTHVDEREFIKEQVRKKREGLKGYLSHYEFRAIKKSGEVIWIDNFTRSIPYEGRPADLVTFIDITEKKKVEEELKTLNKLKSELLTRASHELKTPLMSIKGFTDLFLLKYDDILNEEELFLINEIRKGCFRLETLINDILKTADLESGTILLNKSENNISILIKKCVDDISGLVKSRNHTINLDIPEKIMLNFEPEHIRHAINNILSNAIKYTPPYGKINITSQVKDDFIIISIKDSGIGFSEEEKEQLFKQFGKIERFGQGFDVITEGSGLGLYISKKIVELHGGDVWVESEGRNKGSTFYLSLPITSN